MDNIAALSYIAEMGGGTNNKVLSDLTEELCDYLISEWGYDYSRLFTRSTQCGGRSSVTVKGNWTRLFSKRSPKSLDSGHIPFCLDIISSSISILILETKPIQQRNGCFLTIFEESQGIRLYPLLSHRTVFAKSSNGKRYNDFNNSSMAGATMVTKDTSN